MLIEKALDKAFSGLPAHWRLSDQRLGVQFTLTGAVVVGFAVLSLTLLLNQVRSQALAGRWLAQTYEAMGQLNTLGRDFYRQGGVLREYLQTRAPQEAALIQEGRQDWQQDIAAIHSLLSETGDKIGEGLSVRLAEIESSYAEWVMASDRLLSARGLTSELERDEILKFRHTFYLIEQLIGQLQKELKLRSKEELLEVQATFKFIGLLDVALVIVVIMVLANLYVWIANPLKRLSKGIGIYRGGDLAHRVEVSSRSEIGFLEANFNDMAEKIEGMVTDLKRLDQMKNDFLSTVSHELRTPLTSISGYVKLIATGDTGPINDTQKEFLNIIDTNVVRLTALINDLLDVEKIESGKMQIIKEPHSIGSILKECFGTFEVLARQKGIELKYHEIDPNLKVLGDRARLTQVFMNLVSNAIKYTKKGSVEISATANEYALVVKIKDTGIGLSQEDRDKLFTKFFRTKAGVQTGEGGTGLGLVIVKKLIESHAGKITIESKVGEGSCFSVTLPLVVDRVTLVEKEKEGTKVQGARIVWIIDSDLPSAETATLLLQKAIEEKLTIKYFKSVEDIPVGSSYDQQPACVIFDPGAQEDPMVQMGYLKKLTRGASTVIYASVEADASLAFSQGAGAWVKKPFEGEVLANAVKDILGASHWKVLIADRDTDIRLLTRRSLEQRGMKVEDTDQARGVIRKLEQGYYDLILLDFNLSDLPVAELVKIIRRLPRLKTVPIFLMSFAERDMLDPQDLRTWDVQHFVPKYQGVNEVVNLVNQYLEDRKLIDYVH